MGVKYKYMLFWIFQGEISSGRIYDNLQDLKLDVNDLKRLDKSYNNQINYYYLKYQIL